LNRQLQRSLDDRESHLAQLVEQERTQQLELQQRIEQSERTIDARRQQALERRQQREREQQRSLQQQQQQQLLEQAQQQQQQQHGVSELNNLRDRNEQLRRTLEEMRLKGSLAAERVELPIDELGRPNEPPQVVITMPSLPTESIDEWSDSRADIVDFGGPDFEDMQMENNNNDDMALNNVASFESLFDRMPTTTTASMIIPRVTVDRAALYQLTSSMLVKSRRTLDRFYRQLIVS
jgi:hypothetical protein